MAWTAGIFAAGLLIGGLATRTPADLAGVKTNLSPAGEELQASPTEPAASSVEVLASSTVRPDAIPAPLQTYEASEDTFDQILSSGLPAEEKARQLLDLFPGLTPDAQADAALLVCPLVPDRDYDLLGKYLTDEGTTAPAREILLANLLERPAAVQVPWLQEMARDPRNPHAPDAEALLGMVEEEESAP